MRGQPLHPRNVGLGTTQSVRWDVLGIQAIWVQHRCWLITPGQTQYCCMSAWIPPHHEPTRSLPPNRLLHTAAIHHSLHAWVPETTVVGCRARVCRKMLCWQSDHEEGGGGGGGGLTVSRPLMWIPLRYVFISGMPLPAAKGSTKATREPATMAYPMLMLT